MLLSKLFLSSPKLFPSSLMLPSQLFPSCPKPPSQLSPFSLVLLSSLIYPLILFNVSFKIRI
jgi:hypothetical protein